MGKIKIFDKGVKNFFKKIKANGRSILQILILLIIFFLTIYLDVANVLKEVFGDSKVDVDNFKYYVLMKSGNYIIACVATGFILSKFREMNKSKIFNIGNVYHNYLYIWYWIGNKILGYETCNLKLVPIYTQFKLLLNNTFDKFYVGDDGDYPEKQNEHISIRKEHFDVLSNEINLILSDTYPISENQLPVEKIPLSTIFIVRDNEHDCNRYFSNVFINEIVNQVRSLSQDVKRINIFATTNPKHNKCIVEQAFKLADRGDDKALFVFQQESNGERKFSKKGIKIY